MVIFQRCVLRPNKEYTVHLFGRFCTYFLRQFTLGRVVIATVLYIQSFTIHHYFCQGSLCAISALESCTTVKLFPLKSTDYIYLNTNSKTQQDLKNKGIDSKITMLVSYLKSKIKYSTEKDKIDSNSLPVMIAQISMVLIIHICQKYKYNHSLHHPLTFIMCKQGMLIKHFSVNSLITFKS